MSVLKQVLVIDDESAIRESLEMFLQEKGVRALSRGTGSEGLEAFSAYRPQLVILDIRLPDVSGLDVLRGIMDLDAEAKVIMITAYHDMETTIEAMRQGAYDYIHKPLDVDELDRAVTNSLRTAETAHTGPVMITGEYEASSRHKIVGNTASMRALFKTIGLVSRNRATVLIQGETGSGKELIARVIHESSASNDQPYVTVDCTTLVGGLFESELFGHERGAFTGAGCMKRGRLELAGEGTIFFDEIGDLPLPLQSKLLRFLEYREFTRVGGAKTLHSKARIIAATNHNLTDRVSNGQFRQDLLFRLNVITIAVPPLRERLDDLNQLVRFFLAQINHEMGTNVTRVEEKVLSLLGSYSWPGNIRELKNVLTKAVLGARGSVLFADAVKSIMEELLRHSTEKSGNDISSPQQLEKRNIKQALEASNGNISAAARILSISRPTLRKRLKLYGLRDRSD
ncbi:MAG TPA: sigma-54 dependent transcriptional regulator [Desulfomonilaceae bacterium]|nr:sigma-54 dependent transcriptional regulator [Desulfomonilaceae bacterium]